MDTTNSRTENLITIIRHQMAYDVAREDIFATLKDRGYDDGEVYLAFVAAQILQKDQEANV